MEQSEAADGPDTSGPGRIDGWKEVAAYLRRGVTTVQRWEEEQGLPVRRVSPGRKSSVFAYRHELDAWMAERTVVEPPIAEESPAPAATPRPVDRPRTTLWPLVSLVALIVVTAAPAWVIWRQADPNVSSERAGPAPGGLRPPTATSVTALLTTADDERSPAISPDGRFIAYMRASETEGGVYRQALPDGKPELVWKFVPWDQHVYDIAWSPDGRRIAFSSREGVDTYGLFVTEMATRHTTRITALAGVGLCWEPDGRSVTFADRSSPIEPFALYSIRLDDRTRRRLTTPPSGTFGDTACAWSREGGRLAFQRFVTRFDADLFLDVPSDDEPPTKLARGPGGIRSVEWMPDDETVVYATEQGLQVIGLDGAPAMRIAGLDDTPSHPTVSKSLPGILAYQIDRKDSVGWLWRAGAPAPTEMALLGPGPRLQFPSLSADGEQLAYVDAGEVWVRDVAGRTKRQVTFQGASSGRAVNWPRWSPDGRRLAYSVPSGDSRDIYVVEADGARSNRLTYEPSMDDNPAWSADGRWVYFRSDRGGHNHVWKVPASGGAAVRVTAGEAWQAFESPDGRWLYFTRGTAHAGLWRQAVAGGGEEEELVLADVWSALWAPTSDGIVYVRDPESWHPDLRHWRAASNLSDTVGSVPTSVRNFFTASRDGKALVWTEERAHLSDVKLVPSLRR